MLSSLDLGMLAKRWGQRTSLGWYLLTPSETCFAFVFLPKGSVGAQAVRASFPALR